MMLQDNDEDIYKTLSLSRASLHQHITALPPASQQSGLLLHPSDTRVMAMV